MRWKLFATLAETAGDAELDVTVESADPTIRDAFDALLTEYPALERDVLNEHGDLQSHVRLLHDGSDPFQAGEGWATSVDAEDELALFPPVSGG
jgi:molybdopterin synthase sulfur carrier subunit